MTTLIDPYYFESMLQKQPDDICRQAGCDHDRSKNEYHLAVWGEDFCVSPAKKAIRRVGDNLPVEQDLTGLVIAYYLLNAKDILETGEWISEKEVPGGVTFFRGPHEIPTRYIETAYGESLEGFNNQCLSLGGIPLDMADSAFRFDILPRIPAAVLLWMGDSEFPPESKLLFDKSIIEQFAPDIIYGLAVIICRRISGRKIGLD